MVATVEQSPAEISASNPLVNEFETALRQHEQIEFPLSHRFTPGLYGRTIFMPAGSLIVSKIHKTEHQFIISIGEASVWVEGDGVVRLKAPYMGITKAGTRRVLYIHEDTVWTTYHPTLKTELSEIEAELIHPHNPLDLVFAEQVAREINGGDIK